MSNRGGGGGAGAGFECRRFEISVTAMPQLEAQPLHSSPEDPFEHDSLCSLMPSSLKGFIKQDSIDSFKIQALHLALRQEVLKKTSKVTEQANAILRSTARPDTAEHHCDLTQYDKPKNQQSENKEEIAQLPALIKENLPSNENCPNQQISIESSGRMSTKPPFDISSICSSFGSNLNLQRDPKTLKDMDEFYAAAEPQSKISENMEEIAPLPALSKENLPPKEYCPNRQTRREGSGRVSTRRPFNIISTSFGSNLNSQSDPSSTGNVEEFFAAFDRQETAERIMRKWRGEKSPDIVCSQPLKTRVRRQGTGRKAMPRKYDLKLLGDTEKFMELDEEKLEIEEEEHPVSTFTDSEGQACERIIEAENREINNGVLLKESGQKESLLETVIDKLQCQKDTQLDSNSQSAMHGCDQHSNAHCADDLHQDPFQGKGAISTFETEETVNMPPKNLFASFDNSTGSALQRLLNNYIRADSENIQKGPFSSSGLGNYEIGKPYPKDVQFDTLNTLPQSQTESSNTINSQSLSLDGVRTMLQLGQLPNKFAGSDRTPPQKLTKTGSPLMSPTPPSRISATLRSRRKRRSGDKVVSENASKSSFENRDEEAPKEKIIWQPGHLPKKFAGSDKTPPENIQQKQTKSVSPLTSPTPPSRLSAAIRSRKKNRSGIKGASVDACQPSLENRDEEAPKDATSSRSPHLTTFSISNPSKEVGSGGVRRLSFGGVSQSPDLVEVNSKEGVNDVTVMDLANSTSLSKQFGEDDKASISGDKGASEDASKPSFENRDEEAPKEKTIRQLGHLPKKFKRSEKTPPANIQQKQTNSMSPTPPSRFSAALVSRKKHRSVLKGASVDASKPSLENRDEEALKDATSSPSPRLTTLVISNPSTPGGSVGGRRLSVGGVLQSPDLAEVNSKEGVNYVTAMDLANSTSPSKQFREDDKVEMVRSDADLSNETVLSLERSTPVSSTGPTNCNAVVSEHPVKDVPGSVLGQQAEESPVTFHRSNAKKAKRKSKNNTTTSNCDVHEGGKIVSKGTADNRKSKNKSEYQRRQSLSGAGTLWKSGVRRSTRIRSRPLEYWRGERFLYGRIHNSLATVIGIKYSSPLPARSKRDEVPKLKVQSYVDEQYSHLVEFAALH